MSVVGTSNMADGKGHVAVALLVVVSNEGEEEEEEDELH